MTRKRKGRERLNWGGFLPVTRMCIYGTVNYDTICNYGANKTRNRGTGSRSGVGAVIGWRVMAVRIFPGWFFIFLVSLRSTSAGIYSIVIISILNGQYSMD